MSTLAPLRFVLLGVALLVSPAPGQDPTGRGAKPVDKAALRVKAIEFERKLNLEAYRKYTSKREWLAAKHPGKWVVIAGGKLLPIHTDPKRQFRKLYFEPAKSLAEAVAAADQTVPDARHRFVFRIGEDGDHSFKMGMTTKSHVLGGGFYNLLPGEAIVSGRQLFTTGKGGGLVVNLAQPGRLNAKLWTPVAKQGVKPLTETFLLASVYDGSGTVARVTAEKLHLELWEIPGKVKVVGMSQSGELRRARVLLGFNGTEYRLAVPVAIWPK